MIDPHQASLEEHVSAGWWAEHVAALSDFVAIPSISPAFDAGWQRAGALEGIVDAAAAWFADRTALPDLGIHRPVIEGRTPLLVVDIPAFDPGGTPDAAPTVLVYGHLDVQPAGDGWAVTDPFRPVLRDTLLFGRGTGDDKYVPLAVVSALEALRAAGRAHPRVVVVLETSEESSSVDLPAHLAAHGELLGDPDLVVCLDTFVPDTDILWHSTSMRGIVVADLSVAVAEDGMHSGMVGGIAPSSFRVLRKLLDRVEDSTTGRVLLPELIAEVPARHRRALQRQADHTGPLSDGLPLLAGVKPETTDALDQLLAQSWHPAIAYVGVDGMPPTGAAGSVLRAATTVRLSIRLPPTVAATAAAEALRVAFQTDPPSGAVVRFDVHGAQDGWSTSVTESLAARLDAAGSAGFAAPAEECGGGATIPPLAMMARRFPAAPIVPLGIVTPESHPHGPDENIDVRAAIRLSTSLGELFSASARR